MIGGLQVTGVVDNPTVNIMINGPVHTGLFLYLEALKKSLYANVLAGFFFDFGLISFLFFSGVGAARFFAFEMGGGREGFL